MKIKASILKQIIREELHKYDEEALELGGEPESMEREPSDVGMRFVDEEGEMAVRQLKRMCKQSRILSKALNDDDQLEAWVQAKLTLAAENLQAVFNYLEPDMEEGDEDEDELEFDEEEESDEEGEEEEEEEGDE